jgi:arylsulfatase A-like enzyme
VCARTCVCVCVAGSTKRQPNIIVIMADDLGWNDLGYHNNGTDIRTPYIDQLAGEGITLENYYVQQMCTPSRATLLSGLYPVCNISTQSYAGAT